MTNNVTIQKQYIKSGLFEKENVNYLIRILTRFGTIPKIYSINIITSDTAPDDFVIVPGKSIVIGTSFLKKPIVALIYLRYGIEWQIWYRAFNNDPDASLLYDLAALQVIQRFYTLLPKQDKLKLKESDYFLTDLVQQKNHPDTDELLKDTDLITRLQSFHKLNSAKTEFKDQWKAILENLAEPSEHLLMSGGDLRLNVDEENLLNKYGCRPFPRPEAFTFASSTATSVSNYAFDKTERSRSVLIQKSLKKGLKTAAREFSESLKTNLRKALNIGDQCQIIFSPSGTDSSLQIAAITQIVSDREIAHVLVGSDETGSGVPAALKGLHFENTTALGIPIKKGDQISGFRDVDVAKIPFRDENGVLKTGKQLDDEILKAVTEAHKAGKHIVLHAMDQSKLGYQSPSEKLINKLDTLKDLSMQIIVDGSQLRLDPEDINNYLRKDYIVTITGSKYFTGPPYAGALIVPKNVSKAIASAHAKLPEGLTEYFNRSDWPQTWSCSEQLSDGFNFGTYMRWNAAIAEMKRYYNTPILYRNLGIELFCNFVSDSISETPFLEPLFKEEEEKIKTYNSEAFGLRNIRTIFPFFIHKGKKVLNVDEVKKLYVLLNSDISDRFKDSPIDTIRLAGQKCHIGQAVNVVHPTEKQSAILRISLGARVISESWKDRDISMFFRNIEEQMDQISVIIRKIELILAHPELLK